MSQTLGTIRGMSSLELTLMYLCAAVISVVGCRLLHLPAMLGYLFAGVVIGPNALALANLAWCF